MSRYRSDWTPEQIAEASQHWKNGLSMGDIATRFKVTRSAISGLMNRHRDVFPRKRAEVAPKPKPDVLKALPLRPKVFVEQLPAVVAPPPVEPDPAFAIPFAHLGQKQCHFMHTSFMAVEGPETPCCGATVREGSRYCTFHHKLIYVPVVELKRKMKW